MTRLLVAGIIASMFAGLLIVPTQASTNPLDARLGGMKSTIEQKFGPDAGLNTSYNGLAYNVSGFGAFVATYSGDQVVGIIIVADRIAHTPFIEPDPADWSPSIAGKFMQALLPADVTIDKARKNVSISVQQGFCHSAALAKAFSAKQWKALKAGGKPGDCTFFIYFDTDGNVNSLRVGVGRTIALNLPATAPVPTPTAIPARYSVFSEESIDAPNQRRRWVIRITMGSAESVDSQVAGIVQAVRDGEANHPDAVCVIVFANSVPADSGADVGRGFSSSDGKGLNGEGNGLITKDTGEIQVQLSTSDQVYYAPK